MHRYLKKVYAVLISLHVCCVYFVWNIFSLIATWPLDRMCYGMEAISARLEVPQAVWEWTDRSGFGWRSVDHGMAAVGISIGVMRRWQCGL